MTSNALSPYVAKIDGVGTKPYVFLTTNGFTAYVFDATRLAGICAAVLAARRVFSRKGMRVAIGNKSNYLANSIDPELSYFVGSNAITPYAVGKISSTLKPVVFKTMNGATAYGSEARSR
jgi:hypothetical protein